MIQLFSMTWSCFYLLISYHRDLDIPFVHYLGFSLVHDLGSSYDMCVRTFPMRFMVWGRDESVRHGAGSQWIVAARPLCHLQCPVAYLSRLKGFSPPPVGKGASRQPATAHRPDRLSQWHGPLGAQAPLTWVGASGGRRRRMLAWILT